MKKAQNRLELTKIVNIALLKKSKILEFTDLPFYWYTIVCLKWHNSGALSSKVPCKIGTYTAVARLHDESFPLRNGS